MEALRFPPSAERAPSLAPASGPELSIIVPTFCERGNVAEVLREVASTLEGIAWEIVFVDDDSSDGTAEEVRRLAEQGGGNNIRCIQRIGRRGLSSACIEGMLSVSAPVIAVMDADLQHDTAKLRDMLEAIRNGADLVVGSRRGQDGSFGTMSDARQQISTFSSRLANALLGLRLSDPMSGFFMLRRSAAMGVIRKLSGLGFKILLDVVVSMPRDTKIVEVPYTFRARHAGASKLDTNAAVEFLMLIGDKIVGRYVPVRFLAFAFVGGVGVVIHFVVLTALFKGLRLPFPESHATATLVTMMANFLFNNLLTFRDHRLRGRRLLWGLLSFIAVSSLGALANIGIASALFTNYDVAWTGSALAGIVLGAVWNYAISKTFIWRA